MTKVKKELKLIPVVFEDVTVWYDIDSKEFFCILKISGEHKTFVENNK